MEAYWKSNDYSHMIREMADHGGEAVWFDMKFENSISAEAERLTLTMGKNIVDIWTGEHLGILFLAVEDQSLNELFSSLRLTENSSYLIASETGEVVCSPDIAEVGKGENYLY